MPIRITFTISLFRQTVGKKPSAVSSMKMYQDLGDATHQSYVYD